MTDINQTTVQDTIERVWAITEHPKFVEALAENSQVVSDEILKKSEHALHELHKDESLGNYLMNFSWPELAKSFLILWRDLIFQHLKAQIFYLDKVVAEQELEQLKTKSGDTIQKAATELDGFLITETKRIHASKKEEQKLLEKWKLQQNPHPVYHRQFEALTTQCLDLFQQLKMLEATHHYFDEFDKLIKETIKRCADGINDIKVKSAKVNEFVKTNAPERTETIPPYIEEKIGEINIAHHINNFTTQSDKLLALFPVKTQFPVRTNGGTIQVKTINLRQDVKTWIVSEILPILYEIWAITQNTGNGMKMALLNIRNYALLNSDEKKSNIKDENILLPLSDFLERTIKYQQELEQLEKTIDRRLKRHFKVSKVFDLNKSFLPVRSTSSVNQFQIDQNKWFQKLSDLFKNRLSSIQQFRASVSTEVALTDSEKIVRFVQNRTAEEANQQYSSIFLAKGYIGESFWVGREKELAHIEKLVHQWKANFRGAIILSGQRFSGKSLFGDLVAKRHFQNKVIILSPNSTIQVESRKYETSYDLAEALDFIRKHTINARHLVWIDDFELWSDPNISLSENYRELRRHIDNYSRQTFFMVSMSNWLKAHLEKNFSINKTFQAEINLDNMNIEEIRQAILIRHGATHKKLVDEKGQEYTPHRFKKVTRQIFNASNGNIGEALIHWAFSTFKASEETVLCKLNYSYVLPNFLNPDSAILLAALMMEKRTTEYRLRRIFGLPFKEKYSGILQRLTSIGLLKRLPDGWLEVNEITANPLGELLESMQYLTFHHKN